MSCLLTSCYDNYDNSTEEEGPISEPQVFGATNVSGVIDAQAADYNSLLINGSSVSINQNYFRTDVAKASIQGQIIIAENNGNLTGIIQTPLVANDLNYCNLTTFSLIEEEITSQLSLNLGNSDLITLNNPTFQTENGDIVPGPIKLNYNHVTDTNIIQQMSNHVIGEDGNYYVLDAHKAIILDFKIGTQQVYAKTGIDLNIILENNESIFYLDENSNRWKHWSIEKATDVLYRVLLIGDKIEANYIKGDVVYQADPIKHQKLNITGNGMHTYYTSKNGKWENFIATSNDPKIDLLDPCGTLIQEESVDFSSFNNYEIINAEESYLANDFEVIDCDGMITSEGVIKITTNSLSYFIPQNEGDATAWIPVCAGNTYNISAKDTNELEFGADISWIGNASNLGVLSSCEDHRDGFAFIQIRGDREVYTMIDLESNSNTTIQLDDGNSLKLYIDGNERNNYVTEEVNIAINDAQFGNKGYFVSCLNSDQGCGIEYCEISHLRASGDQWDRVYFEGKLWMQTINPPTAGNFDVRGLIQKK